MKKVSTAAAKQNRNCFQQKLTIGLDLGDRSSWYCLLDEVGGSVAGTEPGTTPKTTREVFGGVPRCRMALETGMRSPWVSRLLCENVEGSSSNHAGSLRGPAGDGAISWSCWIDSTRFPA